MKIEKTNMLKLCDGTNFPNHKEISNQSVQYGAIFIEFRKSVPLILPTQSHIYKQIDCIDSNKYHCILKIHTTYVNARCQNVHE